MKHHTQPNLPRAFALAAITIAAMTVTGCGNSLAQTDAAAETVKVGLVVPTSGVYEPLGVDMTNGFQLYLDQHDGKLGGKSVELVKADEGDGPDTGVPAVNKVILQDGVSVVVGIVNSATALGVKESVAQAQVPLIIANAGANDVADGSDYVWRTSFANGAVGASLGEEVAAQVDGPVYVIAADYAAGHEFAGGFIDAFEAAGGTIAGESYTPFGTTSDWQPFLTQAQNSGAKAVFAFYAGAEAVNFVKQYSQFGLAGTLPLYAPGFLTEGGVLVAQGAEAVGILTSLHYSDLLDSPENEAFVAAYVEAYDTPPTVYSVQAYDAAAVLDLALADVDEVDGESIQQALHGIGAIASPRGEWSFDEQHNPDQPYFLREVESVDGANRNVVLRTLTE